MYPHPSVSSWRGVGRSWHATRVWSPQRTLGSPFCYLRHRRPITTMHCTQSLIRSTKEALLSYHNLLVDQHHDKQSASTYRAYQGFTPCVYNGYWRGVHSSGCKQPVGPLGLVADNGNMLAQRHPPLSIYNVIHACCIDGYY